MHSQKSIFALLGSSDKPLCEAFSTIESILNISGATGHYSSFSLYLLELQSLACQTSVSMYYGFIALHPNDLPQPRIHFVLNRNLLKALNVGMVQVYGAYAVYTALPWLNSRKCCPASRWHMKMPIYVLWLYVNTMPIIHAAAFQFDQLKALVEKSGPILQCAWWYFPS